MDLRLKLSKSDKDICHLTGLSYSKAMFPKSCEVCSHNYINRADYLDHTVLIDGEEHYTPIGNGAVLELRNCICGSTHAVMMSSSCKLWDHSCLYNRKIAEEVKRLLSEGVEAEKAYKKVLSVLS